MKKSQDRSGKEWQELGKALSLLLGNRQQVEDRGFEWAERATSAEGRKSKRIDGAALSDKVRRILGVPLPGEPIPGLPAPRNGVGEEPGRN